MKKPGVWDRGMVTGGPGQKSDWKKWPGLSDSDMVIGKLKNWMGRTFLRWLGNQKIGENKKTGFLS